MNKSRILTILILVSLSFIYASVELNTARICYYNEQNYARAKAACLKGIEKGEINFELYTILGGCEIGLGDWQAAAKALVKAFSIDSLKTHEWMRKRGGETYYYQAFYFSARKLFDDKKFDEALIYIDYAEMLDPKDTAPLIIKGVIWYKQGKMAEANKAYQKALDLDPENPDVNYLIGKALFEAKEFEPSINYFKGAAKFYNISFKRSSLILFSNVTEPSKALQYRVNRLWTHQKWNELDQLIKDTLGLEGGLDAYQINVEKWYKVTDDLARSNYFTGMSYYYLKNDSMALFYLVKTLDLKPDDLDALYFTGEILVRKKDYKAATRYFERATQIKDDDLYAWFYLGVCYMKLKKYEQAIHALENKVLHIDPAYVSAMQNLAFIYRELGDNQKSLDYLERVKQINE
ncbi:MAG: tetratricopeptide repeat protein [bacterium]